MPLQIEFETTAADRGTLYVRGLPEVGPEVLVAVQRLADEHYLTMHGLWDATASWFPCPRLDGDDAASRFGTGAALTAGILGAAREPLRMHLRRRDFSDVGTLRVRGLEPAPAVAPEPVADAAPKAAPEPAPGAPRPPDRDPVQQRLPGSKDVAPATAARATLTTNTAMPHRKPAHHWTGARWMVLALCVICLIALTWWYTTQKPIQPTLPNSPPPDQMPATGKALADDLKRQQLAPADLFQRAAQADQAGDCEAAIRLFIEAASRDAAFADGLARRYDSVDPQPSPCFAEPKPDSAMVWYERAAQAGIPHAQRRYGELLLGETNVGPVYRDAIDWLRKAAAAGDAAAASRLAGLGER
ncbi:hypothetical protein [uncultured Thiodictyon sp.]|uniref:hypothetical protein n=1 Tax=uncultured Thiodictyon sp. TaxID=1846217 RepID=UPI0025E3C54C|nr:hypothetical protein [uncultured Thiodictyon sp.]